MIWMSEKHLFLLFVFILFRDDFDGMIKSMREKDHNAFQLLVTSKPFSAAPRIQAGRLFYKCFFFEN